MQPVQTDNGLTICLLPFWRCSFGHLATLFQIDVPVSCLAVWILQCKRENRAAFLDGIFALRIVGESGRDEVEGG